MGIKRAHEIHQKTPTEDRNVTMDFRADLDDDDTITSVDLVEVTPSGELTQVTAVSGPGAAGQGVGRCGW